MTLPVSGIEGEAREQRRRAVRIGLNGRFRNCGTQICHALAVRLSVWSIENRFDKALQRGRIEKMLTAVVSRKSSGRCRINLSERLTAEELCRVHRKVLLLQYRKVLLNIIFHPYRVDLMRAAGRVAAGTVTGTARRAWRDAARPTARKMGSDPIFWRSRTEAKGWPRCALSRAREGI